MEPEDGDCDWWTHLGSDGAMSDLLWLTTPLLLLVVAFVLPEDLRRGLVFRYSDPTIPTAYTAHFVHLEVTHLLGNVLGYGLLATVCYLLATAAGLRRFLGVAAVGIAVSFPLALSGLNLAVPRDGVTYGFSGLNAGLFGLIPVLLVAYLRTTFWPTLERRDAGGIFFLTVAWSALLAVPTSRRSLAIVAVSAVVGGLYLSDLRGRGRSPRRLLAEIVSRPGYGDLVVVSVVIVVAYPPVAFPTDPATATGTVNLYTHFLGYALGFIASYLLISSGLFDG